MHRPLLLLFLLLALTVPALADSLTITPDMQFSYAASLFETQDFETAQVEFKRFLHFFPSDPRVPEAQFKTAEALFHLQRFKAASQILNQIIEENPDAPFAQNACFLQSEAFLKMGNPVYAQLVLQNFLKLTEDTELRDRIYDQLFRFHIRETGRLGKDELDKARNVLTQISPQGRETYQVQARLAALDRAEFVKTKDPRVSGILAVVPGAGYLYCERYKDAMTSFVFNAGVMYAAKEAFRKENYGLGGVITFVGSGFYAGSIYGSVTAAHKYNKARQTEWLDREFHLTGGPTQDADGWQFSLNYPF